MIVIYANIAGHVYFADCTHDAHCQNCPVGVTGECIYSHSSDQQHCHCPGKKNSSNYRENGPHFEKKDV